MRIFLSNDDGVLSEGLISLANKLKVDNELLIIAPDGNRSAVSHSLTISKTIKLCECSHIKGCKTYSLSGTPADCVKFSKLNFSSFDADIVVSGINKGHNLGSDILYSGTVSIALEASFFGNVAFAFSAFSLEENEFEYYAELSNKIINLLYPKSNKGDVWNVNFPDPRLGEIKGFKVTPLGKQLYTDRYELIGNNEYRLVGEIVDHNENCYDCDIEWSKKGYVTITPLLLNKTDYRKIEEVKSICEKL